MGFGPFFVSGTGTGVERLETIAGRAMEGMGYELVEVQASNRGRMLRIFIDRPDGITLDDCAAVSRHLGHLFAAEGFDYDRMEVSSPGLDRPLRKAEDFVRFAGQKVDVRMRRPDPAGRRRFVGRLREADENAAVVELDGATVTLALAEIERACLVPEFPVGGRHR